MALATRRRLKCTGLAAAALLLLPAAASAFFPPFYNYPYPQPVQVTPQSPQPSDPGVVVPVGNPVTDPITDPLGDPEDPPVVDVPVSQTPEPATLVSGLVGLALFGAWSRTRRKAASVC